MPEVKEESKIEEVVEAIDNAAEEALKKAKIETNSRVARTIRERIGHNFTAEGFDESQFDLLLLEGLDFEGELSIDDKLFLERFKDAKMLNLSYCNLQSIKNLPCLPALEKLDLSDNNLSGKDFNVITHNFKKLKFLSLANNAIRPT